VERANRRAIQYAANKKREELFLREIRGVDHFYLEKHVETMTFLEGEIKRLETLFSQGELDEASKKRLHFLREGPNRIAFKEEKIRESDLVREVELKLKNSIEVGDEDLKRMLSVLEGVQIDSYEAGPNRPQFLMKSFDLTKRQLSSHEAVFVINMQVIKRQSLN